MAALYLITYFFNLRQEFMGPAASGWAPGGPTVKVASVRPDTAMDKAGLLPGDILETVDGHPLSGPIDWFLARANFEIGRRVQLQVRRGEQHLQLQFVITRASWQDTKNYATAVLIYLCRFVPLALAILIAFRLPRQTSARLAAFMLAAAAVAEGYPSPGWMAALRHLPMLVAIPVFLATASWLLGAVAWLAFFAIFPRPSLSQRRRLGLALAPLAVFVPPLLISATATVHAPWSLAAPWSQVFSAPAVHWAVDMAGVNTLFFLNPWPLHQPRAQSGLLELWFAMTVVYLVAGFLMLLANYRRLQQGDKRRRIRPLVFALVVLFFITIQNFFVRNWAGWIGTAPPALFSGATYVVEALLSLVVPFTLAYAVLKEDSSGVS